MIHNYALLCGQVGILTCLQQIVGRAAHGPIALGGLGRLGDLRIVARTRNPCDHICATTRNNTQKSEAYISSLKCENILLCYTWLSLVQTMMQTFLHLVSTVPLLAGSALPGEPYDKSYDCVRTLAMPIAS